MSPFSSRNERCVFHLANSTVLANFISQFHTCRPRKAQVKIVARGPYATVQSCVSFLSQRERPRSSIFRLRIKQITVDPVVCQVIQRWLFVSF